MKSKIENSVTNEKPQYPWIGVSGNSSELIVLFTSKSKGVCLGSAESAYGIGNISETWNEDSFSRQSSITITFES